MCIRDRHNVVNICQNVIDTVSKIKQTQAAICFITELKGMDIETDLSLIHIYMRMRAERNNGRRKENTEIRKGIA